MCRGVQKSVIKVSSLSYLQSSSGGGIFAKVCLISMAIMFCHLDWDMKGRGIKDFTKNTDANQNCPAFTRTWSHTDEDSQMFNADCTCWSFRGESNHSEVEGSQTLRRRMPSI